MITEYDIALLERILEDLGELTTIADGYENDYVEFKLFLNKVKG